MNWSQRSVTIYVDDPIYTGSNHCDHAKWEYACKHGQGRNRENTDWQCAGDLGLLVELRTRHPPCAQRGELGRHVHSLAIELFGVDMQPSQFRVVGVKSPCSWYVPEQESTVS